MGLQLKPGIFVKLGIVDGKNPPNPKEGPPNSKQNYTKKALKL